MTLTKRIIRYLTEGLKCQEVESRNKYRKFKRPSGDILMVGKAGAVRTGTTIANSVSVTDVVKQMMVSWEAKQSAKLAKELEL